MQLFQSAVIYMPNNIFMYNNFFCNAVEPEVLRTEQRYAPLKCVLDICRTDSMSGVSKYLMLRMGFIYGTHFVIN